VAADPFFDTRRGKLVALATRYAVPTMYHFREFVPAASPCNFPLDSFLRGPSSLVGNSW
jgi:hypothetical protein